MWDPIKLVQKTYLIYLSVWCYKEAKFQMDFEKMQPVIFRTISQQKVENTASFNLKKNTY